MEEMNIALATDKNYIIPITVVLQSIFTHHKSKLNIFLCFLENSLTEENILYFKTLIETNNCTFYPLQISHAQLANLPNTRHGKAALLRLYLPELLPNVRKILYLDGDIVVTNSLMQLYNIELGNNYIAASKDTAPIHHQDRINNLEIDNTHWYFNSGVTLMNLEALRKINLLHRVDSYAKKHYHQITSPDQDVLNYICQGHTIYIHPRYNFNFTVEKDVAIKTWGKEQIKEAKTSPTIVHYIGPIKPWSILCIHPKRKLWWKTLKMTPYKQFKPKDLSLKNYIKRYYLLIFKKIENQFTLTQKQRIGRVLPNSLKIKLKKSIMK